MAKKTAKAQPEAQTKATQHDNGIKFYERDVIVASCKTVRETDNYSIDSYKLADHVTIDVCYLEEREVATINMFGVAIRCNVAVGKNGRFVSLPQYKTKGGEYKDLVTIFSKEFHEALNVVMECVDINAN